MFFTLGILYYFSPFLILYFIYVMANLLHAKHTKSYREGLNDLFGKQLLQLEKIKELAEKQNDWKFIDKETVKLLNEFLAHGKKNDGGVEIFKDEKEYSHEQVHMILDNMIKMIQAIQKITIANKEIIYNNEVAKLNQNKNIETLE